MTTISNSTDSSTQQCSCIVTSSLASTRFIRNGCYSQFQCGTSSCNISAGADCYPTWPNLEQGDELCQIRMATESDTKSTTIFNPRFEIGIESGCFLWGKNLCAIIFHVLHENHPGMSRMKAMAMASSYLWWSGLDKDKQKHAYRARNKPLNLQ